MLSCDACTYLQWDSEFFERRIARINSTSITPESIRTAVNWCKAEAIDCLYFKCAAENIASVRLAEDNGFRLVDIRLTLEARTPLTVNAGPDQPAAVVRPFQSKDLPALQDIARISHCNTRFFNDSRFSKDHGGRFYATWVANSCRDSNQAVWVVESEGQAIGYCTCSISEGAGHIGLIAVKAGNRQQGMGQRLLARSLTWFGERVSKVLVATQGTSAASQRFYIRCGFVPRSVELWYHKWFT